MRKRRAPILIACLWCVVSKGYASNGTEGASFLDIPVGARPAALGSAYTAMADDAYAPTWNPGGLGQVQSNSIASQYVSYIDSIQYEYLSFVHPFSSHRALGVSVQYLGTGNLVGADAQGNPTGDFSTHYAAYNFAFGQALTPRLSAGITGKWINASIADVNADAYAVDFGAMYQWSRNMTLGATLTNLGSKLTFLSTGNSLPLAFHMAGAYHLPLVNLTAEGVFPQSGTPSFHAGVEWNALPDIALRGGYRTDTIQGLSPMSGMTLGIGIKVWGQEFSYAWLPLSDLGNTNYFSLVLRFGGPSEPKRNLIRYNKPPETAQKPFDPYAEEPLNLNDLQ